MARLPVIIGFGGINAAGRSSSHQAYKRMVIDNLDENSANETYQDLGSLMGICMQDEQAKDSILNGTLIRKLDPLYTEAGMVLSNKKMGLTPNSQDNSFTVNTRDLPADLPTSWAITQLNDKQVSITIKAGVSFLYPEQNINHVQSAGQLPQGFEPGKLYQSRNHPRGIHMTVYGASDAIQSTGIPWSTICSAVGPEEIAVYASSAMSQLDDSSNGGMMKFLSQGKRITSKQCAFGFAGMPADFINAYIINSVGATGGSLGACATFLYNLRQGVYDIQSGNRRVALIGTSEAPIVAEVMEGYRTMGALAEDEKLIALDAHLGLKTADHRRACRPFGDNCGFTIAESAQYLLLCDDDLALELGAQIHGAVPDVFVYADGNKKSISAPGVGNFITVAKAARLAQDLLGSEALQRRTFVHAHGTGTPKNRVTESEILNEVAKTFGIKSWPVAAIKSYLGHSIGSAGGDQVAAALGTWQYGLIPGIKTIKAVADDVHDSELSINLDHVAVGKTAMDASLINAKGFGGNNGTALLLAPHIAQNWMAKKHGEKKLASYRKKLETVTHAADTYNQQALQGKSRIIYNFGENVLEGHDISLDQERITLPGYEKAVQLKSATANLYNFNDQE